MTQIVFLSKIIYKLLICKDIFQAIHDAEADVEILKIDLEKARDALANAKLKLREQQKGGWLYECCLALFLFLCR